MRQFSPLMSQYLANPDGFRTEVLVQVSAMNRTTGVIEQAGFWTGDRHRSFTVEGATLIFYGAGSILSVPEIAYEAGLNIATFDIEFSPLTPEFTQAVRVYDVRQQPFRMYEAYFDAVSGALIEAPTRIYKGRSDDLDIRTGEEGSGDVATLTTVSSARSLTRTIPANHSDVTMSTRSGDRIGRYTSIAGVVEGVWGKKVSEQASTPNVTAVTGQRDQSSR